MDRWRRVGRFCEWRHALDRAGLLHAAETSSDHVVLKAKTSRALLVLGDVLAITVSVGGAISGGTGHDPNQREEQCSRS